MSEQEQHGYSLEAVAAMYGTDGASLDGNVEYLRAAWEAECGHDEESGRQQ